MAGRNLKNSIILKVMEMFEQKNVEGFLELCTDDCVLIDPHYPQQPLKGKAAIRKGLEWAFKTLEQPVFDVQQMWVNETEATVLVQTRHRLKYGFTMNTPQIFYLRWDGNKIAHIQSFLPYHPDGVLGVILFIQRLIWRIFN